jgi:hypothetical protein
MTFVFVVYDASLAAATYIFRGGGGFGDKRGGGGGGGMVGEKGGESFYPFTDLQIPIYLTLTGREAQSRTVSGKPKKIIYFLPPEIAFFEEGKLFYCVVYSEI